MNSEARILHIVFGVLYLTFLLERGYFQARAMRVSGEAKKIMQNRGRAAAVIFVVLIAQVWVIGSFVYLLRPAMMEWTCLGVPSWLRWLGAIITANGMALEFSTQLYLGRSYSTTLHISDEQTLVTGGPYRHIRHPMYTALFLVGIGMGLLSASWYFLIPFVAVGIVVAARVLREEEAMIDTFGDEYVRYAQRTGRFLPRIGKD